jgi:hypothetical protein
MPPRGLLLRTPPARRQGTRSAFGLDAEPQPLRVVIDYRAMERGSAAELLLSLCSRSEAYLVGDATQLPNRLEFEDLDQDDEVLEFTIRSVDKVTFGGIWFSRQREERTRELLGVAMTPDLLRGVRLAAVAEELEADAFVSADPLLLNNRHVGVLARANVRSVEEAVALVGLLLRSRGDYVVWPELSAVVGLRALGLPLRPHASDAARGVAVVQRLCCQWPPQWLNEPSAPWRRDPPARLSVASLP